MRPFFLMIVASAFLWGCTAHDQREASVTLEFRPGETAPGEGLTEMAIIGSDKKVYLRDEVVLSNADVASASVVALDGPGNLGVRSLLTRLGAQRLRQAAERNIMKPIAILLDGKVVAAPIVRDMNTGRNAEIRGSFTVEEAKRIADGIVPK